MRRESRFQTWLLALLCVALLLGRVNGAHLHLCLDGSEPPASLHLSETGHDADHHNDTAHDDVDVTLPGDAASKPAKLSLDLPLLVLALLLLRLPRTAAPRLRNRGRPAHTTDPLLLRPPLRGPPLNTLPQPY